MNLLWLPREDPLSELFDAYRLVYLLFADGEDVVADEIFVEGHLEGRVEKHVQLRFDVVAELVAERGRVFGLAELGVQELHYNFPVHLIIEELSKVVNCLIAALARYKKLQLLGDRAFISIGGGISKVSEYMLNFVPHVVPI